MSTRMDAVEILIKDAARRNQIQPWRAIFDDPALEPPAGDPRFEKYMFTFLKRQLKEGVKRQDKFRSERRSGRLKGNLMHISSAAGRYIFAVFGWHEIEKFPDKASELESMAAAFRFRLDPQEIDLKDLSEAERVAFIARQYEDDDEKESRAFLRESLKILLKVLFRFSR